MAVTSHISRLFGAPAKAVVYLLSLETILDDHQPRQHHKDSPAPFPCYREHSVSRWHPKSGRMEGRERVTARAIVWWLGNKGRPQRRSPDYYYSPSELLAFHIQQSHYGRASLYLGFVSTLPAVHDMDNEGYKSIRGPPRSKGLVFFGIIIN